jgi:hypothetical protein
MSCRRAAAWFVALPLMVAGSQVAHVFAYRLVYPEAGVRLHALLVTGHSYMTLWPKLLAMGGALELAALVSIVVGTVRRRRYTPVPPWAFALTPPLAFALQELFERWFAGASFPWWMVLQPTFRVGLLLQVPFALLTYLLARLLLRVADRVGKALRRENRQPRRQGLSPRWHPVTLRSHRIPALADGHAGRAPPLFV